MWGQLCANSAAVGPREDGGAVRSGKSVVIRLSCNASILVLWNSRKKSTPMHVRIIAVLLFAVTFPWGQAFAWGYEGHEVVGSLADQMLTDHAKQEVRMNLGFELRVAAPWPDCVRSVVKHANGTFEYAPSKPEYRISCTSFETPQEQPRMEDYVRRNWDACVYLNSKAGCEDSYHFADVAIQHDHYERSYAGTNSHDIVSAINAAIAVLKDRPAPSPFSIRDKKEALFLLAHFVGDLHQPLHVGAIYLDRNGATVNPDIGPTSDQPTRRGAATLFLKGSRSTVKDQIFTRIGMRSLRPSGQAPTRPCSARRGLSQRPLAPSKVLPSSGQAIRSRPRIQLLRG